MEKELEFQALKSKNVLIYFPKTSIGDCVCIIESCERFRIKYKCNLFLCLEPHNIRFLKNQYKEIKFIKEKEKNNFKFDKIFNFLESNLSKRFLISFFQEELGLENSESFPKLNLSNKRKIKDPYICISVQSTSFNKLWTYPNGWDIIIEYLQKILGYKKIFCIDLKSNQRYFIKIGNENQKIIKFYRPKKSIPIIGKKSIQKRIDLIKDADFFIGLSSGVSWLAWACKIPVVMISGFTNPKNEFYTPYRIFPSKGCMFCNDSKKCKNLKNNFENLFFTECSLNISPQMIIDKINQIPIVKKRLKEFWKNFYFF